MQTFYFDNQSVKEQILSDMVSLVKIFSVSVVVLSIVLVTIQVCETVKRDFKLRNIFNFSSDDKKIAKKPKKDIKHLKNFKVHYIDGLPKDSHVPAESRQPLHTLMPLPLPVHLPIPTHDGQQTLYPPPSHPLALFQPEHLAFHHDPHLQSAYLRDNHQAQLNSHQIFSGHLLTEASNPMMRALPPPIIITQDFSQMELPITLKGPFEEGISFPVFELLDDPPIDTNKKLMRPKPHSFEDKDRTTNLETNRKNNRKNHSNDNKLKKQKTSKDNNKDIQTAVRLVNNRKFNTIHNINTHLDNFYDQDGFNSKKVGKSNDENSKNSNQRQSPNQRNKKHGNDIKASDNKIDEKIYTQTIPEEQVVNLVEDEWTFKDLDLWIIR